MSDLLKYCNKLSPLTKAAGDNLLQCATVKIYKKGTHLLMQNHTCRYIYFINEGLLKLFFVHANKEFVMRFFSENTMFSVFDSYISQTPSTLILTTLEDTTVTSIGYDNMEELCKKHHCMETLFRKLVSMAAVKMTKRIREMLEANASIRYDQFLQENSNIIQRISIGDIAKYVGITQQSLSRIRAVK